MDLTEGVGNVPALHWEPDHTAGPEERFSQSEATVENSEIILLMVNLAAGVGCAIPLARLLANVRRKPSGLFRWFAVLIAVYFIEGVALAMGMGIPVFSVGLALVWGIVFGLWLRRAARPVGESLKAALWLSLYTSLPALSFLMIPLLMSLAGWSVLDAAAGERFGIPGFLPWPVSTILGFYVVLALGAAVLKTLSTTGGVRLLVHSGRSRATDGG
jgi:hypothetical protein